MDQKSYIWIREEEDKNRSLLKEEYNKSLRQWVIASFAFIVLFFIYHFVLVPNIQLIQLLTSGKKDVYDTHIAIKSLLLVFIFLSFVNATTLMIINLLRETNYKKNKNYLVSNKLKTFITIFKAYLFCFYFTLILLVPAKSIQSYLKQVLIISKEQLNI